MIRVGLFLAALIALPVFDVYLVFRFFARANAEGPDGHPPPPTWLDSLWVKILAGAATVLAITCIFYGRFVEPGWVATEQVALQTPKLPNGEKFRIVFLTDLHLEPGSRITGTSTAASMLDADVILLGGDYMNVDSHAMRKALFDYAKGLNAREGVFAVGGNWDRGSTSWSTMLSRAGVTVLDGKTRTFRGGEGRRSGVIELVGLSFAAPAPLKDLDPAVRDRRYTIVLHHSPDIVESVVEARADLFLSGHTHGGQVCLPLYGALVTLSRYGKKYESGLFREGPDGATAVYVSRGLGQEGGWVPRVRFCCRPEVTVIDIVGTGE